MSLLDELVPGWTGMDLAAFRLALQSVPGRHRPQLRAIFEAELTARAPAAPTPTPRGRRTTRS